jgi:outer membrane protein OmpA-like peptidoglycan-associated protein
MRYLYTLLLMAFIAVQLAVVAKADNRVTFVDSSSSVAEILTALGGVSVSGPILRGPRTRSIVWHVKSNESVVDESDVRYLTRHREQQASRIAAKIQFVFDSYELSFESEELLEKIAVALAHTSGVIRVVGHTDSVGGAAYNERLSKQRAQAVGKFLSRREVKLAGRIVTEGMGFQDPYDAQHPWDGINRRVEIQVERVS